MSGLKTFFLTLALLPAPLLAMQDTPPDGSQDLVPLFASCVGRYSAQMEDAWNAYDPANPSEGHRATFETLLDTVRPGSPLSGPQILQLRLEAKFAQAHLLSIARFHTDPRQQRRARAQAALALRPCQALLL